MISSTMSAITRGVMAGSPTIPSSTMSAITEGVMAGAPILPSEVWLISCDGLACFKWSLMMVESYLPNIRTNINARASSGFEHFFHSSAGGAIGIMVEGVRSDVLTKIDEYMRYLVQPISNENPESDNDWLVNFLSNLDADMMKKLKSESEERARVEMEAAGAGPSGGRDTAMQLLADCTESLCRMCVDRQLPMIRATRGPDFGVFMLRVWLKMREERGNEPGYFGNV